MIKKWVSDIKMVVVNHKSHVRLRYIPREPGLVTTSLTEVESRSFRGNLDSITCLVKRYNYENYTYHYCKLHNLYVCWPKR